MPDIRQLSEFSRQELYDLIWSTPTTKVAAQFGVSDVAVHKRCIRQNVPRPTRGYWAKIEAGQKPPKKPLPPSPAEVFAQLAQKPLGKRMALPEKGEPLHPLASELMQALTKAKPDYHKRVNLREPTVPEVLVSSKVLAEKVAQAFHVILNGLEPLGISFRKSQSSYHGGHFRRGQDKLHVCIEETLVDKFGSERRVDSWQWQESGVPSGRLAFTFKTDHYRGEEKQWIETAKVSLERLLPQIISALRQHFLDLQSKHAQEAIERKKRQAEDEQRLREWRVQEAIRLQKEKEQNHVNALKSVTEARKKDLIKAAEWWRLSREVKEFADECEKRWRTTSGELTSEQTAWLAWANEIASKLSPFSVSYPDPSKHGAFDPSTIPFGGPYPSAQNFSQP